MLGLTSGVVFGYSVVGGGGGGFQDSRNLVGWTFRESGVNLLESLEHMKKINLR